MSFVPAPQQANAAVNAVVPAAPAAAAAPANEISDYDLMFKIRTFDVFWVDKYALMYRDGIAKVRLSRFKSNRSNVLENFSRNILLQCLLTWIYPLVLV
jgi:hypothetical protein